MTGKKKNILVSIGFILFGIVLLTQSVSIKPMMKNDLGSGFFPTIIGAAIIVVALILLVFSLREKETGTTASDSDMAGGWLSILLLLAYVAAFNRIGFIISTMIYLFFQILVLAPREKRSWPVTVILSVVAPLFIYGMFVYVINSPLPKGIFGF